MKAISGGRRAMGHASVSVTFDLHSRREHIHDTILEHEEHHHNGSRGHRPFARGATQHHVQKQVWKDMFPDGDNNQLTFESRRTGPPKRSTVSYQNATSTAPFTMKPRGTLGMSLESSMYR